MTNEWIILAVIAWIATGYLSFAMWNAHALLNWTILYADPRKVRNENLSIIVTILMGPVGLFATWVTVGASHGYVWWITDDKVQQAFKLTGEDYAEWRMHHTKQKRLRF